jgi:transcription elongation factor GreA-like protein/transcription elongation GreA/GreB family factor
MPTEGFQMSYLKDFLTQISSRDYPAFVRLWEEYCMSDEVDPQELKKILVNTKSSEFGEPFGKYVENILPLWELLPESPDKHEIFKLIIDLETTNHEELRQKILTYVEKRYPHASNKSEKIRLTGLRGKDNFQSAVANFELLDHMMKGKFVFHTGGWGVGEIIDVSMIREQLSVEFENVPGKKDLSFANAFKNLIPIPDEHFLALRFGKPDELEEKAKEQPAEVIRMLLRDLGPKTASEIKDELCELVIPEDEWAKWWQNARMKIKKDTMIEAPEDLREPFVLRSTEVTHEDRLRKILEAKPDTNSVIHSIYSFSRDFPETLKNPEFKSFLYSKAQESLTSPNLTEAQQLQLDFFMEDFSSGKNPGNSAALIKDAKSVEALVQSIEVLAFKKRALMVARKVRSDWKELFLNLLFTIDQNPIRDYIFLELDHPETRKDLIAKLEDLLLHPARYPDAFVWYFQKMISQSGIPFSDKEGKNRLFDAFFVVLHHVEQMPTERELVKKMHTILIAGRYAVVRDILQGASLEMAREFLLLSTKCHSLTDHDLKILHSLAEVVHPSLGKMRKSQDTQGDDNVVWTTEAGFNKVKARIQEIATVETIENAREIEVARSHGDLRENAEFKAALEKRSRLQSELKTLSDLVNRCRIITQADVSTEEVGIGCIVTCQNKAGKTLKYTLLGPWDADTTLGILAFQSKLAQAMKGLAVGDKFQFQGDEFTVTDIQSYLEKN